MKTQKSFEQKNQGTLFLVPTPIGNLEDITFRAVNMLKAVDLIASEDTRNTQKLLNHFKVETPQTSFHEHNSKERTPQLIEKIKAGQSIAQVSDAGMPSISDPGVDLVRAAVDAGITVVPLPGPNAALTALIASGLSPQPFYFLGFLPRKKKDLTAELEELNKRKETLVFYESPHRVKQVVETMQAVYGSERKIVLAREVTKRFEEFIRGTMEEVCEWLSNENIRGEFVIIVEGNEHAETLEDKVWESWTLKEHVSFVMENESLPSKKAIKEVALLRDIPKREVYAAYHELEN
ncbi:16S rRNA (cytidine(1402)-2'-O)-methyltransferase [Alkalibacterium subtropicum]|uniref:16S rRNA (cytidine(1402)-2'-O)-methyltransferase n=1 Tax=Alkalibacterium subtropicum TaxID=753702 RepID=UPI000B87C67B|nr:16S rRNA (cytidine(1402)-2'-O)-methyltransferase [Alkalibacterium subtropicum]